jgi:predicted permease
LVLIRNHSILEKSDLSTEWREFIVLCVLAFYFLVAFGAGWKFVERLIRKKKRKTDLADSDSFEK